MAAFLIAGCSREKLSKKSPIHLNPNMDSQQKYKAQSESDFFADGATMRKPVPGTVSRGDLYEDEHLYSGVQESGEYVSSIPVDITLELMARGQERYGIYCSPCHGGIGDGKGIITYFEYPLPPASLHQDRIRQMPDGEVYHIISNGIRNMPSYRHQIGTSDRWAIVAYVRALQRSQNAKKSDIPVTYLDKIK
jgi:hypothetical protein